MKCVRKVEEVANIGSMHVLGQQVNQNTMEVVNGVVEGTVRPFIIMQVFNLKVTSDLPSFVTQHALGANTQCQFMDLEKLLS